mmetsp:Transcript_9555/g.11897  ORF Transcript_9555/g.11897 Transcript_9555/m.11897 type:complete len:109 (+) Transcript_9555:289-615(+)
METFLLPTIWKHKNAPASGCINIPDTLGYAGSQTPRWCSAISSTNLCFIYQRDCICFRSPIFAQHIPNSHSMFVYFWSLFYMKSLRISISLVFCGNLECKYSKWNALP